MFSNRLPSTTALRVFESAVRHGSCCGAASELCLTQSAVSKQLRSLESSLGATLFHRTSRGLLLTQHGNDYWQTARDVLQKLERAATSLDRAESRPQTITLKLLQTLGERWLMPRFPQFAEAHPHIQVQFTADVEAAQATDAEFCFGAGYWPGRCATYLFGHDVVLVASPQLLLSRGVLTPLDALTMPRLVHRDVPEHWRSFTRMHGQAPEPAQTVRLGYYSLLIQSAVVGLGVALVPRMLVTEELASGVLVNPLGLGLRSRLGYYFVCPGVAREQAPGIAPFAAWLALQQGHEEGSFNTDVAHLDDAPERGGVAPDHVAHGLG